MESGGAKLTVAASLFYKANYPDIGRRKTKLLGLNASWDNVTEYLKERVVEDLQARTYLFTRLSQAP